MNWGEYFGTLVKFGGVEEIRLTSGFTGLQQYNPVTSGKNVFLFFIKVFTTFICFHNEFSEVTQLKISMNDFVLMINYILHS